MEPGIYTMPAEDYHADPCDAPSLSASLAKVLLAYTPQHAMMQHPKLNPDMEREECADFDRGNACHGLLFEGEDRIEVISAADWKTKAAREDRDSARAAGLIPLLPHQAVKAKAMCAAAKLAITVNKDLAGVQLSDGKGEQAIIWKDELGCWCRCRVDWLHNDHILIMDLKTTAKSANPISYQRNMFTDGHDIQAAFNLRGLKAIDPACNPKFVFMVQESEAPFAVSFIGMPPAALVLGMDKAETAIRKWARCVHKNEWPGYGNNISWAEPPPWATNQWNEALEVETL